MLKEKFLRNVSIEFFERWQDGTTGKNYNHVLTALAVMGCQAPAVPGLNDFNITFKEDNQNVLKNINNWEVITMDDPNTKEFKDSLVKNLNLENSVIKLQEQNSTLLAEKKESERKLFNYKHKMEVKKVDDFLTQLCTEKNMKILPRNKALIKSILMQLDNEVITFEESNKKLTHREQFKEFLERLPVYKDFQVFSENFKGEAPLPKFKNTEEARDYLDTLANNKIKEFKEQGKTLKYSEAVDIITEKYKELK